MGIEETGVGVRLPSLLFNKLLTLNLLKVFYIKKKKDGKHGRKNTP